MPQQRPGGEAAAPVPDPAAEGLERELRRMVVLHRRALVRRASGGVRRSRSRA